MKSVWNMWFSVWTYSYDFTISAEVDSAILNEALIVEFFFLSIPQIVIQVFNNFVLENNWYYLSYICISIAVSSFINGLSRYGFFLIIKDLDVSEVPLEVNLCNNNFKLAPNKSEYNRATLFKIFDGTQSNTKAASNRWNTIVKDYHKTLNEETKRAKDMKKQDAAWNILVNYAGDTFMIEKLRKLQIMSPEDLNNADTKVLSKILASIDVNDKDYRTVVREIFKLFPNFDDGIITKNTQSYMLAEGKAFAEENISTDML